ncbi:uncharacterized protein LOC111102425 [Crassostrea virginica]
MRGPQILLLFIFVVCVKSVIQPTPTFYDCLTNEDCPLNAKCNIPTSALEGECECDDGFYPFDSDVTLGNGPYILCALCVCDPTDHANQCNQNGKCVVELGRYVCNCKEGFTGKECETPITTTTPMTTMITTAKRGNVVPIVAAGAGLLVLALLGVGAAAASSG